MHRRLDLRYERASPEALEAMTHVGQQLHGEVLRGHRNRCRR